MLQRELTAIADLHLHTTRSDGRDSPAEVVDWALRDRQIRVIAITDHDTIRGAQPARERAQRIGAEKLVPDGFEKVRIGWRGGVDTELFRPGRRHTVMRRRLAGGHTTGRAGRHGRADRGLSHSRWLGSG